MGHRLSRIYTRTGDQGTTGLSDGSRVAKDSPRITVLGSLDELNSQLGLLLCEEDLTSERDDLISLQHALFDLGSELCIPGHSAITARDTQWLEERLDTLNESLPPLKEFILPGGNRAAAICHIARTVCRRAECQLVALSRQEPVRPEALAFINRLSDFLFVLARVLARKNGASESLWQHAYRVR